MSHGNQGAELGADTLSIQQAPSLERAFSLDADILAAQQAAFEALPEYEVVVESRKPHKAPVEKEYGTLRQETVRYSDGAVRLVTLGIPDKSKFTDTGGISAHAVLSGDPLFTGPDGLNDDKMERMLKAGFGFVWHHHHGRHSLLPTSRKRVQTIGRFLSSKSVGKSAHHDFALLDDLEEDPTFNFNLKEIILEGYSRRSMTGEAFIALSPRFGREVVLSDLDATCFLKRVSKFGMIILAVRQVPGEVKEGMGIVKDLVEEAVEDRSLEGIVDYAGTLDGHPLNMAHELAWAPLLTNGDSGIYAAAVPLGHNGIRTQGTLDYMSQPEDLQRIHQHRSGIIHHSVIGGAHLFAARATYLDVKFARLDKARLFGIEHGGSIQGITAQDILPEEPGLLAA